MNTGAKLPLKNRPRCIGPVHIFDLVSLLCYPKLIVPTKTYLGHEGLSSLRAERGSYSDFAGIDVMSSPVFEGLESFYQRQALEAALLLNRAAHLGYGVFGAKRIIDFGSSAGGPTLALVSMTERNGGTVDALERNNYQVQAMIRSGILSADRAHAGDGLKFLGGMAARGESCDLITAFMLGPD